MGNAGSAPKPEVSFNRDQQFGSAPPKPKKKETFEEKVWRKVRVSLLWSLYRAESITFVSTSCLFAILLVVHVLCFGMIFALQFSNEPLIPIGCVATAYFLISGLKSFRDRDPFKSQRMMRNRVAAQFATLLAFIGYIGLENADFRYVSFHKVHLGCSLV